MSTSARAMAGMPPPPERAEPNCPTCGSPLRQRSDASHRLFFAVIAEAFKQWPETEKFQPEDAEHLMTSSVRRGGKRHDQRDSSHRAPPVFSLRARSLKHGTMIKDLRRLYTEGEIEEAKQMLGRAA